MAIGRSKIIVLSVFIVSFLAFFAGFRYNAWQVLENDGFLSNQAESLLVGRLVKSRTDGIFSSAGLCGRCTNNTKDTALFNYQYKAFVNDQPCNRYTPYLSQIGFLAVVYRLIDKISPFSSATDLKLLWSFKSGMLALVMSLIVLWFLLEFGLLPAIFVSLAILLTPWFTFLGRDLWFCVWTNFLPFLVALFLLRREHLLKKPSFPIILLITNLAILFNFIYNGFEWVTTTLIMSAIPFFYYWRKGEWPLNSLIRRVGWLVAGSLTSIFITFSILLYQISTIKGTYSEGIRWIIFSFQKRTYGGGEDMPEVFIKQLEHSVWEVFLINFGGAAFRFPRFLADHLPWFMDKIFFAELVFLLILITFLSFFKRNLLKLTDERRKILGNLSVVTWISLLAPFSWFIIFKGHAYSHHHINYITWFMPFGLFLMALIGMTIKYSRIVTPFLNNSKTGQHL